MGRRSWRLRQHIMVLLQNGRHGWEDLVITAAEMRLNHFLRSEPPSAPLSLSTTAIDDERVEKGDHQGPSEPPSTLRNSLWRAQGTDEKAKKTNSQISRAKFPRGSPDISAQEHIEFAVRRNLEHILSVCAIPITLSFPEKTDSDPHPDIQDNVLPVALTCGAMSGHRVCTSAS